MRTPRAEARYAALFAALAAAAAAAVLAAGGRSEATVSIAPGTAWRGLVGAPPPATLGDRAIVVLRTPSLADHVASLGGSADVASEQAWTKVVLSAQKLLLARLALQGVLVHPDERFLRVLDGFSAVIPPGVVPIVERDPDVAGVYPVRAAYPAAVSYQRAAVEPAGGALAAAGVDGRGVTVAVLDTGVDATLPLLQGRLLPQIDVAAAAADAHGTEMAGVIARVAPGASILPIRVVDAYARTDQLIVGLDRAVDPNGDGDAHDAARIALVALEEPYAGFADGPEALAVAGARALDLVVVAAAGDEGATGTGYGDIAAPGGSPDALTVGALDTRPQVAEAHVVMRSGLHTLFDATVAFAGAAASPRALDLQATSPLASFFTRRGGSIVAGRAALLAAGASPAQAAAAGASVILLDGRVPAGALGASVRVPVVSLPRRVARSVRARLAAGAHVSVVIGAGREVSNPDGDHVAGFSSTGLAYDGSVKPDVVAPGVGVDATGRGVNGSSVAAAVVAGSAALLAQVRPSLGADALRGLLAGTARPVPRDLVTAQGAGALDAGAAAAGEVAASPTTLALGISNAPGRKVEAAFTLTNVSSRPVQVVLGVRAQHEGAATIHFALRPSRVALAPGRSAIVHVDALTTSPAIGSGTADGAVVGSITGGGTVRIPWAIGFEARPAGLIRSASIAGHVLTVDAGRVLRLAGRPEIRPLARLDVVLRAGDGRLVGLLARVRDVLPGRYVFQLTGRGPGGAPLPRGAYVATVLAYPADGGPPEGWPLRFTVG